MGENDIRRLLKDQGQQLTLDAETASVNRLALQDVNDYIASVTVRHMKVSMKSIYDRFQKAPYGFVEADIQWLIAKLFKDGDITLFVNSEVVTRRTSSDDEILRYLTRKEFLEKLMMEKQVKAE